MEYAKKYKWALVGFIVMVLLNIGLIVTIWMIMPPPQVPGIGVEDDPKRRVQRFLQRELNLDKKQIQQIRKLRRQHFIELRPIMEQVRDHRSRAMQLVTSTEPVPKQMLDSLTTQIGRLYSQIERQNYRHFQQIRTQLNEAQQEQFDSVIQQMLNRPHRMMRGVGRGPGGGMF